MLTEKESAMNSLMKGQKSLINFLEKIKNIKKYLNQVI